MGPVEAKFNCIVDKFQSWIPRRTDTSDTSRVFWMPDQSCRVCYECDLPFTIFNRRHHCRICGRVFCGRCTVNTIPAAFAKGRNYEQEDRERIRVCIFCFKQWEREIMPAKYDGLELLSPGISPSLSCTSLASSESSGNSNTTNSSSIRFIMPHSAVPYQHSTDSTRLNLVEANGFDQGSDNTDLVSTLQSEGPTSSTYGNSSNRSEDEDDGYTKLFEDPEWHISKKPEENYQDSSISCPSVYSFNKVNSVDLSFKIPMDQDFLSKTQTYGEQFIEEKTPGSSQSGAPGTENHFSVMQERSGEESESTDNGDECNDESPMFESTSPESEQPMDIEKNGIIWIPPEPEDEEDEKENSVYDDDDDDGGGWDLPHSTGSFTDSEYKSKDRVNEEHRKAMRAVLDGHFRALVAQLLKAENVPVGEENNKESWLEIVTSLSWQAASLVKPDTSKGGGGMDPGGYVKVKCLACGHPYQSEVIKGVVCKKNIANRRMTKSYKNPRLLILGGALEYQRVSNVLSSLDTLIQQEKEHLKMTVAKVEAHHPNVLLVEKTVSRPAQDYLLAKEISLVLNIKRPLLERIARCTGAQIVPSVDNLTAAKVGHCESFHVDKFVEEHDSAGQTGRNPPKTLMFFEGCPKPLGCTVTLLYLCTQFDINILWTI